MATTTSPQQQQRRYEVEIVNIIMGRAQFVMASLMMS